MKYYDDFLKLVLFSKKQANEIVGNSNAAKVYLRNAVNEGSIAKVKHDYYAVKSLETKQAIPNRFAIGSQINTTAFISHHTAFEFYGMSNQIFNEVFVSSEKKFREFSFDGLEYRYLPSQDSFGVQSPSKLIRVTDIERTILDNLKDFHKYGGLEELLSCLSMVTIVEENKLLSYLDKYDNQFLFQKAGFLLAFFSGMKLSSAFFIACKFRIGKSRRYLYEELRFESPKYISDWQLYVPADLSSKLDEGAGIYA